MKDFSLFSFILGAAGGAALASWIIKSSTSSAANAQPSGTLTVTGTSGLPQGLALATYPR